MLLSHRNAGVLGWTDIPKERYTAGSFYVESQDAAAQALMSYLRGQLLPPTTLTRLARAMSSGIPLEPQAVVRAVRFQPLDALCSVLCDRLSTANH